MRDAIGDTMSGNQEALPRVLVAVVSHGRSKALEEIAKAVADIVRAAGAVVVRNVVAQGEATYGNPMRQTR